MTPLPRDCSYLSIILLHCHSRHSYVVWLDGAPQLIHLLTVVNHWGFLHEVAFPKQQTIYASWTGIDPLTTTSFGMHALLQAILQLALVEKIPYISITKIFRHPVQDLLPEWQCLVATAKEQPQGDVTEISQQCYTKS